MRLEFIVLSLMHRQVLITMPQHDSLVHCIQGEDIEQLINQIRWKLKAKPNRQLVWTSSLGMSKQAMNEIN